eukprot:210360-Hanusia_phi.AAC.3
MAAPIRGDASNGVGVKGGDDGREGNVSCAVTEQTAIARVCLLEVESFASHHNLRPAPCWSARRIQLHP